MTFSYFTDVHVAQRILSLLDERLMILWKAIKRYLAYNLTPVAGVAAHISRNGHPAESHASNTIMSPLPLSCIINIPVTVVGSFLVRHNRGRYLFRCQDSEGAMELRSDAGSQLIEAWNRELMSCVCDSYIKLILEMQKLRREPLTSALEPNLCRAVSAILSAYRDEIYSFWPRSGCNALVKQAIDDKDGKDSTSMKPLKADWECLIEQVIRPLYARLVELPVWQLYSGSLVKATDVPWELVTEIQAVGVAVREIKPRMVRDLLRASSSFMGSWSIGTYIDVLEYCLSDIHLFGCDSRRHGISSPASVSSGGDAIDMMTSFGKALFDFGRGVVEDISRAGGSSSHRQHSIGITSSEPFGFSTREDEKAFHIACEIKGLPFPTAKSSLVKLGFAEVWVGNKEEQSLITSLAGKFIHPEVLERPVLQKIFCQSLYSIIPETPSFLSSLAS
ncbi:UNVERIFIED_CONTAM: hypothetical protein Sradi_5804600 [Sesamum radiatum]|uniref:Uncharacterized protein n=1 Tax=Sesamum radiatum TaxID=300843 RepID=A0AAW2KQ25_SESRA